MSDEKQTPQQLVERLARMGLYVHPESGTWSEDQAEDALSAMNSLIMEAREIAPHIAPGEPILGDEERDADEALYAPGIGTLDEDFHPKAED